MEEETQVEDTQIEETTTEPSEESAVEEELERIETEANAKRTKLERLQYNKERIERELAEEAARNGVEVDEDKPLTLRDFKAMQAHEAQETAKSLAESQIADDKERKLVLHHLENTIRPSGDAATDLRNARLIVNAVKTRQIAEEVTRSAQPRAHASAAGAPPKRDSAKPELSPEEKQFASFAGLSDDEVKAAL